MLSPHPEPSPAITTEPMDCYNNCLDSIAGSAIVANAGATKCQPGDCEDSTDTRLKSEYEAGTGLIPTWKAYPADYPNLATPTPLTDSNNNGIADAWETSTFGGLVSATDDFYGDGYNNIEYYLHYLTGDASTPTTRTNTGTQQSRSNTGTVITRTN